MKLIHSHFTHFFGGRAGSVKMASLCREMPLGCSAIWFMTLLLVCASREPCTTFSFPNMDGHELVIQEPVISLPFRLANLSCISQDDLTITIKRKDGDSLNFTDYCEVQLSKGRCVHDAEMGCGCARENGLYQLTKTVKLDDDATKWLWTSNDTRLVRDVQLNFTYAARITNLSLEADFVSMETVDNGTQVNVTCAYYPGNPPVKARLLDRHGVEMEGSIHSSGQIRYKFLAVGCQDTGLIRCEAPGASQNKSANLFVKSRPELQQGASTLRVGVVSGEDVEIKIPVCAHTTAISNCRLIPLASSSRRTPSFDCRRGRNLTGTPPDLTLTVRLDNVREEDEGKWQVELSNEVDIGNADFFIEIITDTAGRVAAAVVSVLLIAGLCIGVFGIWRNRRHPTVHHVLNVLHIPDCYVMVTNALQATRVLLFQGRRRAGDSGQGRDRPMSGVSNLYMEIVDEEPPKPCGRRLPNSYQGRPQPPGPGPKLERLNSAPRMTQSDRRTLGRPPMPGPPKPPRLSTVLSPEDLPSTRSTVEMRNVTISDDYMPMSRECHSASSIPEDLYLSPSPGGAETKAAGSARSAITPVLRPCGSFPNVRNDKDTSGGQSQDAAPPPKTVKDTAVGSPLLKPSGSLPDVLTDQNTHPLKDDTDKPRSHASVDFLRTRASSSLPNVCRGRQDTHKNVLLLRCESETAGSDTAANATSRRATGRSLPNMAHARNREEQDPEEDDTEMEENRLSLFTELSKLHPAFSRKNV